MTRGIEAIALAVLMTAGTASAADRVVLSGELVALEAQQIYCPPSDSSPVVLRYYVAEGARVKKGDVLVRIDAGQAAAQIETLSAQIEQARAKAAKEVAELRVKAIDAQRALVDADAALDKAKVDAAIPREHLSALDYDRYQGELERATRERGVKAAEQAAADAAVARREGDARLEVGKLEAELAYNRGEVALAEVRAERDGLVLHDFDSWRGNRLDEGASTFPGRRIGQVVDGGPVAVRAWALEPERARLAEGQAVELSFDALPGKHAAARVARIGGAPDVRAEWGSGRYYLVEIALDGSNTELQRTLLPGMSVRVDAQPAAAVAQERAR